MTDPDTLDSDPDVVQAPDELPARPIAASAGAVVAAIALSVVVVLLMARCDGAPIRVVGAWYLLPEARNPDQVNNIAAEVFGGATVPERARAGAARRLDAWGWSDRARRRVHVPIDVAAEEYLEAGPARREADR